MFDAHAHGAAEEGDGVFGDELFEGDEEAGFESNEAVDWGGELWRCRDSMPDGVDEKCQDVRYQTGEQHEFSKLFTPPSSFKISPAEKDHDRADDHGDEVVFDDSRRYECPGVDDALGRDEDEVGHCPLRTGEVVCGGGGDGVEGGSPFVCP